MNTDFLWGISTSSYQVEGATKLDNRETCIWDTFAKQAGKIVDASDGSIACDHYHKFKEDIQLMKQLGVKAYRFSIAWPRIINHKLEVNQMGLEFYNRLVNELLANNIEPWVCFYHWDLPQFLQDLGGWTNREICKHYCDYVEVVANHLGDRVKHFIMINEHNVIAWMGHMMGIHAPGLKDEKLAYAAAHHLNLAQGMGIQRLRKLNSNWNIGTVMSLSYCKPISKKHEDFEATKVMDALWNRSFLDPLFHGCYPEMLHAEFEPHIQTGDMQEIQQPIDFLGVNYYTTTYAMAPNIKTSEHSFAEVRAHHAEGLAMGSQTFMHSPPKEVVTTALNWEVAPLGFYHWLMELKNNYGNPLVFITENGAAFEDKSRLHTTIQDDDRIDFYEQYLAALFKAKEFGANIQGYFAWTLLDNYEWAEGYTSFFGLVHVDRNTLKRSPKKSFYWYRDKILKHCDESQLCSENHHSIIAPLFDE